MRSLVDRMFGAVARAVSWALFRRFETSGFEHIPRDRPILIVANHYNGFVDPLVVIAALHRLPRFVAKAALGKVVVARPFLRLAGVVLVNRRQDDASASNESAFAACSAVLARNDMVAIFPEGTTHDRAQLDPIKTGAARIALDARRDGAQGLVIVPIGLTFPDKVALRAEVCVRVGRMIDLDEFVQDRAAATTGSLDHVAVDDLTDRIDDRLRGVVPNFATVEEWWAIDAAAEIATRDHDTEQPLVAQTNLSSALSLADATVRANISAGAAAYLLLLRRARLSDASVADVLGTERVVRNTVLRGILIAVVAPFLLLAVSVNALPAALVAGAGAFVRVPVTKGTVRILAGIVLFPAAWLIAAAILANDIGPQIGIIGACAIGGYCALLALETAIDVVRTIVAIRTRYERRAYLATLREHRQAVVDQVERAVPGPL